MELRDYWSVLARYWLLVVSLTLLALVASAFFALRGPTAYKAEYTLAVSIVPEPRMGPYFGFSGYYEWLASEYLADDLSEVLQSQAFAEDVSTALGQPVDPASISDVTRVRKTHRLLEVAITDPSPERALAIASAHEQVLNTRLGEYLGQLRAHNGYVAMINRPIVRLANTPLGLAAEIGLRGLVGLLAGIGLAFLLYYLDPTIRERRDAEQLLEAPVLGEVPLGRGLP